MATQSKTKKTTRRRFTEEYRKEALGLAERVGVAEASRQLGIQEAQIYSWRAKSRLHQDRDEAHEQMLAENARPVCQPDSRLFVC